MGSWLLTILYKRKELDRILQFYNQQSSQKLWKPYIRYLGFFHRGCVLIAHWANFHSPFPLLVSLLEKFLHDAVCPLPIQFQGLGWVAQVCTVHHVAKDLKSSFGNPIKLGANTTRTSHPSCTSTLGTKPKNIFSCIIIIVCASKKQNYNGAGQSWLLTIRGVPKGKMCVFLDWWPLNLKTGKDIRGQILPSFSFPQFGKNAKNYSK